MESGSTRRLLRISDSVGNREVFDPAVVWPARSAHHHRSSLYASGKSGSRIRIPGRSGTGPSRSALAPGGAAIREAGFPAHSRWNGSPAVSLLSGHSIPPFSSAHRGCDIVHGGAFGHAYRIGIQHGAGRALVSAAG